MFSKPIKSRPPGVGPVLAYENKAKKRDGATWSTRSVFDDLCGHLEQFEDQGWQIHTVQPKHSAAHGDYYWVLLRRVDPKQGKEFFS